MNFKLHDRFLTYCVLGALLGQLLDIGTTLYAIKFAGATEVNGFLLLLLGSFWIPFKLLIPLIMYFALCDLSSVTGGWKTFIQIGSFSAVPLFLFPAIWNIIVIIF